LHDCERGIGRTIITHYPNKLEKENQSVFLPTISTHFPSFLPFLQKQINQSLMMFWGREINHFLFFPIQKVTMASCIFLNSSPTSNQSFPKSSFNFPPCPLSLQTFLAVF